jgi:antidote-toxin recognition MazE-like antitoxin
MPTTARPTSRDGVRAHRTRLRKAGLRPVQIWVPDAVEVLRPGRASPVARGGEEPSRRTGARRSSMQFLPGMKNETWRDLDDRFDPNDSIVACPLTTDPTQAPIFRLSVQPTARSGRLASRRASEPTPRVTMTVTLVLAGPCWVSEWRASRLDPNVVLKADERRLLQSGSVSSPLSIPSWFSVSALELRRQAVSRRQDATSS